MKSSRFVRIYLQDHDAIASVMVQLVRRTRSNNSGGPLGRFLDDLTGIAERQHATLLEVMEELDVRPRPDKRGAVWIAERVGRLKLNGRLVRYSDLSRVFELEGVAAVLTMNLSLWEALLTLREAGVSFTTSDLDALVAETRRLRDELADHRLEAVKRLPG